MQSTSFCHVANTNIIMHSITMLQYYICLGIAVILVLGLGLGFGLFVPAAIFWSVSEISADKNSA